ncbi:Protein of unknown function [Pyronema omphalodes CBS 100304]|uniref:Uncharacterized protein n=1 Tax=Pyronema omphalodes (strain CBS 100304) TaxID=1076935 RepID=U4KXS8_PYROM|nr:Protein of unknown function [Pyronema omphalodes CBS 100304]
MTLLASVDRLPQQRLRRSNQGFPSAMPGDRSQYPGSPGSPGSPRSAGFCHAHSTKMNAAWSLSKTVEAR